MTNIFKILLLLIFTACSVEKDFTYTKISVCNEPIAMDYAGKIHLSVSFPHNGDYNQYETFIITDSLSISIYGKYNIPVGTKTYIIYTDNSKQKNTATFYWEGERQTYKIIRN